MGCLILVWLFSYPWHPPMWFDVLCLLVVAGMVEDLAIALRDRHKPKEPEQ